MEYRPASTAIAKANRIKGIRATAIAKISWSKRGAYVKLRGLRWRLLASRDLDLARILVLQVGAIAI